MFQLFPLLKKFLEGKKAPNSSYIENLVKSIKKTGLSLQEMHKLENKIRNYPLFSLEFRLDEDLNEIIKMINK